MSLKWIASEDASFVAGDSPATIDILGSLSSGTYYTDAEGYLACDGAGNILVEVDAGEGYGGQFTMKTGEVIGLGGSKVTRVKITHSGTNSAYRLLLVPRMTGSV